MSDVLRLLSGFFLLCLASLTVVPAPARFLWYLTVAATEGGHWLAAVSLLPAIPLKGSGRVGRLGGLMSLCAAVLFTFPVVQAHQLNAQLPAKLDAQFGNHSRDRGEFSEGTRPVPLVMIDLITRVQSRTVRLQEESIDTADGEKLALDIFHPSYLHGPLPAVIVIHGGTWQDGDRRDFVALSGYLAARDLVVASVNYRLAPKWRFPTGRNDVFAALAYLKVHARDIGIDPTRFALLGRSSGGQLALLSAYTAGEPAIRGVISMYAPSDLRLEYDHPAARGLFDTRGTLEAYLGGSPAKNDAAYYSASPINFVTATSPPTLLIHGLRDAHVAADQSARLDARLEQAKVKHFFLRLPWASHGCDWSLHGPCGQVTTYAIEHFLDRVLAGPASAKPAPGKLAARTPQKATSGEPLR